MTCASARPSDPFSESQSAFVRGFIDDAAMGLVARTDPFLSQSAFVRGFIDDPP